MPIAYSYMGYHIIPVHRVQISRICHYVILSRGFPLFIEYSFPASIFVANNFKLPLMKCWRILLGDAETKRYAYYSMSHSILIIIITIILLLNIFNLF